MMAAIEEAAVVHAQNARLIEIGSIIAVQLNGFPESLTIKLKSLECT